MESSSNGIGSGSAAWRLLRPAVRFYGPATAFAAPPVVTIAVLQLSYIVQISFPTYHRYLHRVQVILEGNKTMHMEGAFRAPNSNSSLSQENIYSSPRVRRLYPPTSFTVSFDFPEAVVAGIAGAGRLPDGTFQITVLKAGAAAARHHSAPVSNT